MIVGQQSLTESILSLSCSAALDLIELIIFKTHYAVIKQNIINSLFLYENKKI